MKRIERSALVGYSAEQMYQLVNDFESYPQFMKGCVGAELLSRGEDWLEARLELSKAGIQQSFVTHNDLIPPTTMRLRLVEGPFTHMEGEWFFQALSATACKVNFWLEFEFSNKLLGFAAGRLFEQAASEQVDALCRRAKTVYG
ncbi:type II toxin-antitoxin system RatA family toxin [Teredinibacter waterburyi]|uniref:type II toxin-antitoxin system RatA family toxin n=1 Tax=Teredinibacter waterburyi TaxID=1500538 RepID=UPI00165F0462|nr:type II toxin-antitoxin system RatA family toxin [Teredinibacter waterburyi]